MLIRREVYFSTIDKWGDERLYSTTELIDEDSYLEELMYSDETDGAFEGIGATGAGLAALTAAGYGAKKGLDEIGRRKRARRLADYEEAVNKKVSKSSSVKKSLKDLEKAQKEYELAAKELGPGVQPTGGEAGRVKYYEDKLNKARQESRKKVISAKGKNAVTKAEAGTIERLARRASMGLSKAENAIRNNKKLSAGIAAGTIAAGAGYGAYRGHKRNSD